MHPALSNARRPAFYVPGKIQKRPVPSNCCLAAFDDRASAMASCWLLEHRPSCSSAVQSRLQARSFWCALLPSFVRLRHANASPALAFLDVRRCRAPIVTQFRDTPFQRLHRESSQRRRQLPRPRATRERREFPANKLLHEASHPMAPGFPFLPAKANNPAPRQFLPFLPSRLPPNGLPCHESPQELRGAS